MITKKESEQKNKIPLYCLANVKPSLVRPNQCNTYMLHRLIKFYILKLTATGVIGTRGLDVTSLAVMVT